MSPTNRKCESSWDSKLWLTFLCITDISHRVSYIYQWLISTTCHVTRHVSNYLVTSHVLSPPRRRGNCGSSPAFPATQDTGSGWKHCGRGGGAGVVRGWGGGGAGYGGGALYSHVWASSCHQPCNCSTATDQRLPVWRPSDWLRYSSLWGTSSRWHLHDSMTLL